MNCYVCGFPRPEGANYCPGCGRYCADDPNVKQLSSVLEEETPPEEPSPLEVNNLPEEEAVPKDLSDFLPSEAPAEVSVPDLEDPEPPEAPSPVRKKKHRPILIPVLIMAALFTVGTIAWFAMPYPNVSPDTPAETTQPAGKKPPLPSDKQNDRNDASRETYPATDDRYFRIKNGIVSFIPERHDGGPILVIPSEIDGQTVTGIAEDGFRGLENVTTLILPDTLETIGAFAFADCPKLRGVYVPDSVKSIGEGAFSGCIDMESVSISAGTTAIGKDAFDGCASLMYIFYGGTFEQWDALYNEYITPFTYAICSDGDYYHGAITP